MVAEPTTETVTPPLQVEDLSVSYQLGGVRGIAVRQVGLELKPSERFGLVGESGSGKSTVAMAILRMVRLPGRIDSGRILLDGRDLLGLSEEEMRRVRLAELALVPQGAMSGLNPVLRIRKQFALTLRDHGMGLPRKERAALLANLLHRVGLPASVADKYPHELSGGMKQRVSIAMAMSLKPRVIVADEPTSALDVVAQRQVMETLEQVQSELGAALLLIGHDIGLMAQSVDRIGVMYAGSLVEVGNTRDVFREPLHPYTRMLIASVNSFDRKGELKGIPGFPPSLLSEIVGCPFAPRCPQAFDRCTTVRPELRELAPNHWAACHLY